jgi:hypothetical protein
MPDLATANLTFLKMHHSRHHQYPDFPFIPLQILSHLYFANRSNLKSGFSGVTKMDENNPE